MSSQINSCDVINKILDFKALSPALQSSIRKIIEKEKCTQYEVTVKDLNTRGDNLLGKLYEVNIKCITTECVQDIDLFAKEKMLLKNVTAVSIKKLYESEELVYKDLSKTMTLLQDRANVPPEERFKIVKAYDETSNDAIILENLRPKGFTVYNKAEPVSLKFFELGIQQLAKLHALSFVIQKQLPEYFEENIAVLESPFSFNEDWKGAIRNTCKYVAGLYDDETKIKIDKFVPIILEKLPKYHKDKTNICTLSHGDYKKNNIMVKFNDDEAVEVVPIDYQFSDYGCPIRDLLYFIFTTTDREFRRKHLKYVKELYFETLSQFLQYFDMDVKAVYPREQFEKLYTEWLDYGLMMTLAVVIVIFAPDTGLDLDNNAINECQFCPDKKYDYILRGLIDDFIEWGYL